SLPQIGILAMQCKVDTGAKTSALHAFKVDSFERNGQLWVRFSVHLNETDLRKIQVCEAKVIDKRSVTDSGGNTSQRFFIETLLEIGESRYPIQVSLTDRDTMKFNMLLGRTALRKGHFIVDPSKSYLQGKK
ncbi:MAG: ATP-dependent zinc protease, partial [Pseudomonadota bacterium]